MKAAKLPKVLTTAAYLLFIIWAVQSFAIEGLRIAVQSTNVVLSWPSVETETYIVQYRPSLATGSWQTLVSALPASAGTNITYFTHSNAVPGGGGSFAPMSAGLASSLSVAKPSVAEIEEPAVPLVMRADGTGSAVPLALYPQGFDLSGFVVRDPVTGETVNAAQYTPLATDAAQLNDLQPPDGEDGGATNTDTGSEPDPNFYRVVRNGVHFWGLTNGTVLSGVVDVPIEMSLSSTDQITGISFYSTGEDSPLVGADCKDAGSPWVMEWDTTMVPNGTYSINASVNFAGDESVTNDPVTVTINNVISFNNYFTRIFGDWMWIYAETTEFPAYFDIDMYADGTNYLGTFSDYTYDGYISFLWDLTDGNGYAFTNQTFTGVFTITPDTQFSPMGAAQINGASSGSSATATNFWAKETRWSGVGKFVVAYSPLDNNSTKTFRIGLMVAGGTAGEYGGVTQTLGNYGLGIYQLSPGNGQGSAYQMADGMTKTNLLSYLWDISYRNFYYFGHGSSSAIGGAPGTPTPTITRDDLQHWLFNFLSSGRPANYHPYRLVFLDGCQTGKGKLCEKFGIPAQTVSTNFFITAGVRSRAFLGFKQNISYNDAQWSWRSLTLSGFFQDWQNPNLSLWYAVTNAAAGGHTSGYQPLDSSWVIYGAPDMNIFSP